MKVKNIMFSGFAAAILMGVAAEASAAPVAVASKGYVDSVAGNLTDLAGEAQGKTNLVDAVNVKLDPVSILASELTPGEYYTSVKQTTDGQVAVSKANLAIEIGKDVMKAPTTDAVYQAIEGVRGDIPQNVQTAIENGSTTATAGFFNKVTQTNGKVSVEEKPFDTVIDSNTGAHTDTTPSTKAVYDAMLLKQNVITDGEDKTATAGFIYEVKQDNGTVTSQIRDFDATITESTTTAPTSKAVYDAIEDVRGDIPQNVQTAIENGSTTATAGFFNKVTQTNGKVSVEEKPFDTVIDSNTGAHTDTTPSTKAVYDAIRAIPVMPDACQNTNAVCVLTSEAGEYKWAILTSPIEADAENPNGLAAQAQLLPEPDTTVSVPNV